jgi:excisionase family DNA binding protein
VTGEALVSTIDRVTDAANDNIRWLGTTEAAERLGVVPRTLYRMIDEGQIAAYKMGRVIRVKESDLDTFLESTRVQPGELKHLYPERAEIDD